MRGFTAAIFLQQMTRTLRGYSPVISRRFSRTMPGRNYSRFARIYPARGNVLFNVAVLGDSDLRVRERHTQTIIYKLLTLNRKTETHIGENRDIGVCLEGSEFLFGENGVQ